MTSKTSSRTSLHTLHREPLTLLKYQRTHVLLIFTNATGDSEESFLSWYQYRYRAALLNRPEVLSLRHYRRHRVDVLQGRFPIIPYNYMGICEISVDGASAAQNLIDETAALHKASNVAEAPTTWLYYPVCEKVGSFDLEQGSTKALIAVAFANGYEGRETEFDEWYATRHIRHAMHVSAYANAQCFKRTQFQKTFGLEAIYSLIAIYELNREPEDIIRSFQALPIETFSFPSLDVSRFSEVVYQEV